MNLMSTGEQLADRPDNDPKSPFDFINELRENSEKVRTSFGVLIANPCRESLADFKQSIAKARESVLLLYNKDFFKKTGNPVVVSNAISALTDSIRDTMACLKELVPDSNPNSTITLDLPEFLEDEDAPELYISLNNFEDISDTTVLNEPTKTSVAVNKFADLILEGNAKRSDMISAVLLNTSDQYYSHLEEYLSKHPKISAYIERQARNDRYKVLALKSGTMAVSAFLGTAAAELMFKYL